MRREGGRVASCSLLFQFKGVISAHSDLILTGDSSDPGPENDSGDPVMNIQKGNVTNVKDKLEFRGNVCV